MAIGQKYHISLNDDGKWQVKGEKAEKALKLFNTQKEAIAYAKTVAGNQEGNIVIHKVDGKIRKQDYSKPADKEDAKEAKSAISKEKAPAKDAKPATKPATKAPAKEAKPAAKAPAKPADKKAKK